MSAKRMIELIEEIVDLKIRLNDELKLKVSPEIARVLRDTRERDRERLNEVRAELLRLLQG